ncbi:hypothetical protein RS130_09855 [Paraglaciecola aquimarina]|uniref:TonB-dependent receptor n=1 Tax=Paraglaciecola aquimarina TaxID=1235557 RepID=A0ABU3SW41_9ALTE|nr:hypothetical protein [Paraglaciecola aquimarina]MDU0354197.1 hypothetical protein [Paraglaciecola aquimarina]
MSIAFLGTENVAMVPDKGNSNLIEQDMKAGYIKFDFELMDGRLTGDFGIRRVKSEVYTEGFTNVTFEKAASVFTPYDLVHRQGLTDRNKIDCDVAQNLYVDGSIFTANTLPHWDQLSNPNCYEPEMDHLGGRSNNEFPGVEGSLPVAGSDGYFPESEFVRTQPWEIFHAIYNGNGAVTSVPVNMAASDHPDIDLFWEQRQPWSLSLGKWMDFTTTTKMITGLDKYSGAEAASNYQRHFAVSDRSSDYVSLPSLNLNYVLNDEVIVRFAASKTMTRP